MNSTVEDVIQKYEEQERQLDKRLQQLLIQEVQLKKKLAEQMLNKPERDMDGKSLSQVKRRNHQIIKELEMSRAKLRSLAIYSPLESILQNAALYYKEGLSNSKNVK